MTAKERRFNRLTGIRIRVARMAKGITQSELAFAIGKSRPSVANIEAGVQGLSLHDAVAVAAVLGVAVDYFYVEAHQLWKPVA